MGGLLLVALAIWMQFYLLIVVVAFSISGVFRNYKLRKAARDLRKTGVGENGLDADAMLAIDKMVNGWGIYNLGEVQNSIVAKVAEFMVSKPTDWSPP